MKIIFCDLNALVIKALENKLKDYTSETIEFEFLVENICNYPYDVSRKAPAAIVSPANSYGVMTGGIDLVYVRWMGPQVAVNVQNEIKREFNGFLPIGNAVTAKTEFKLIQHIIAAPTMNTPMDVRHTMNAFLAFNAILLEIDKHKFQTVICPGLGTLTGNISPESFASQVVKSLILNKHINEIEK